VVDGEEALERQEFVLAQQVDVMRDRFVQVVKA
jgi:hypothetical protein